MQTSLTYDVEEDDLTYVVDHLLASYGVTLDELNEMYEESEDTEEDEPEATAAPLYPEGWTKRKMTAYMSAMKPTAQKATLIIAKNPKGIQTDEVMTKLGITHMPEYAGAMASAGFAARNTRGVKSPPWRRDYSEYTMHPKIAELVKEAAVELGIKAS